MTKIIIFIHCCFRGLWEEFVESEDKIGKMSMHSILGNPRVGGASSSSSSSASSNNRQRESGEKRKSASAGKSSNHEDEGEGRKRLRRLDGKQTGMFSLVLACIFILTFGFY